MVSISGLLQAHLLELGAPSEYPYFQLYWSDLNRHTFVFEIDERLAGFALARTVEAHGDFEMAEFYVSPRFRRRGVGRYAATTIFSYLPGHWSIPVHRMNAGALMFWANVVGSQPTTAPKATDRVIFEYFAE